MALLERKIRRYEHMRWAQEPNRKTLPFAWGLEYIGGSANEPDPRGYLDQFVEHTLAHSDDWYATGPASDYSLDNGVLTFTSAIESPWPENNLSMHNFPSCPPHCPAASSGAMNRWEEQTDVCWLSAPSRNHRRKNEPRPSRPPRRSGPSPRRHLVGPNNGLTLRESSGVPIARRTLRTKSTTRLGRLGVLTSIGYQSLRRSQRTGEFRRRVPAATPRIAAMWCQQPPPHEERVESLLKTLTGVSAAAGHLSPVPRSYSAPEKSYHHGRFVPTSAEFKNAFFDRAPWWREIRLSPHRSLFDGSRAV
jgi:hypothetical protein